MDKAPPAYTDPKDWEETELLSQDDLLMLERMAAQGDPKATFEYRQAMLWRVRAAMRRMNRELENPDVAKLTVEATLAAEAKRTNRRSARLLSGRDTHPPQGEEETHGHQTV